jgi:hypothetical protein
VLDDAHKTRHEVIDVRYQLENIQMRLHVVRRQFGSTNLSISHHGHLQIPKFN